MAELSYDIAPHRVLLGPLFIQVLLSTLLDSCMAGTQQITRKLRNQKISYIVQNILCVCLQYVPT